MSLNIETQILNNKIKKLNELSTLEYSNKINKYIYKESQTGDLIILRRLLLFLMLYLTGINIDVLLNLKIKNLMELLKNNKTFLIIDNKYYYIHIDNFTLKKYSNLENYYKNKKDDDFLFATIKNAKQKLRKNNVLKEIQSCINDINKINKTNFEIIDFYHFCTYKKTFK